MNNDNPVHYLKNQVISKEWDNMFVWQKQEVFIEAEKLFKEQIIKAYRQACLDMFVLEEKDIDPDKLSSEYYKFINK